MRKGVLYESVKRFVKTRKEDLNAFFSTSLQMRKFEISCCVCFVIISLVFFYLCKVLFSGFLQFNSNFVDAQNNSKYS